MFSTGGKSPGTQQEEYEVKPIFFALTLLVFVLSKFSLKMHTAQNAAAILPVIFLINFIERYVHFSKFAKNGIFV